MEVENIKVLKVYTDRDEQDRNDPALLADLLNNGWKIVAQTPFSHDSGSYISRYDYVAIILHKPTEKK